MNVNQQKALIEGLLFVSGEEGITKKKLADLLELTNASLETLLEDLTTDYQQIERGVTMMDSNGTLHLTTKPEHAPYYKKLLDTNTSTRLSQAALETLAIIAYRQPITRIEIDDLRGVKSDRAVQTLGNRGLIDEKGRKDAIGRPVLFGTTKDFLTYFGLTSIEELPPLKEIEQNPDVEEEADLFFEKFNDKSSNET
ncbi:SMC-Scp complex subunit ScpB [Halobacillus shinanisalinarum]|uniref:Segregation and condensation protein B n=1 Tax=Halobacillus shinanisalinarum TaxID=2932258 RepID=A0ABY4H0D9_9BACI|nr:SMC-Scp complex subunit ScpB [Halobacillus shinanisalinarum]UOQ93630.1 SMC-Scp complex subunit ScpB [Halobacillus shinanisalinarum]